MKDRNREVFSFPKVLKALKINLKEPAILSFSSESRHIANLVQ